MDLCIFGLYANHMPKINQLLDLIDINCVRYQYFNAAPSRAENWLPWGGRKVIKPNKGRHKRE